MMRALGTGRIVVAAFLTAAMLGAAPPAPGPSASPVDPRAEALFTAARTARTAQRVRALFGVRDRRSVSAQRPPGVEHVGHRRGHAAAPRPCALAQPRGSRAPARATRHQLRSIGRTQRADLRHAAAGAARQRRADGRSDRRAHVRGRPRLRARAQRAADRRDLEHERGVGIRHDAAAHRPHRNDRAHVRSDGPRRRRGKRCRACTTSACARCATRAATGCASCGPTRRRRSRCAPSSPASATAARCRA